MYSILPIDATYFFNITILFFCVEYGIISGVVVANTTLLLVKVCNIAERINIINVYHV